MKGWEIENYRYRGKGLLEARVDSSGLIVIKWVVASLWIQWCLWVVLACGDMVEEIGALWSRLTLMEEEQGHIKVLSSVDSKSGLGNGTECLVKALLAFNDKSLTVLTEFLGEFINTVLDVDLDENDMLCGLVLRVRVMVDVRRSLRRAARVQLSFSETI
ncbi:hypothetical protein SLEP1_g43694 [Rubroshorea leprosula]|uniref:Uncharacterized protein n=1 Tax=Rubroshorea leprosula TaxID=152421 RepID=A0AAV5LDX8_9ROSI|nr:hypothetical protein SLEP1_g43694 [Rubroshorea leprosula]